MKISVIVPVYNVEAYLERCLDSIVNQTYQNLEIIVINDGTKDNSQRIIDNYSRKYPQLIKSYIKENGGLGDTCNFGLKKATGEYISFVDSDDWIEKNFYEEIVKVLTKDDYDCIIVDINDVGNGNEVNSKKVYKHPIEYKKASGIISNKIAMTRFLHARWNKVVKRQCFENVSFIQGYYEDLSAMPFVISQCQKVYYLKMPLYNYRTKRADSAMNSIDDKIFQIFNSYDHLMEMFEKNKKTGEYRNELEIIAILFLIVRHLDLALQHNKIDYKNHKNKTIAYIKSYFPNYKKNSYYKSKEFYKLRVAYFLIDKIPAVYKLVVIILKKIKYL